MSFEMRNAQSALAAALQGDSNRASSEGGQTIQQGNNSLHSTTGMQPEAGFNVNVSLPDLSRNVNVNNPFAGLSAAILGSQMVAAQARGTAQVQNSLPAALASLGATKSFLPSSAPVSSLLPQLPQAASHNTTNNANIQAQLLALLGSAPTPSLTLPNQIAPASMGYPLMANDNNNSSQAAAAAAAQLLAAQAAAGAGTAIPSALQSPLQNWSLEQLEQHVKVLQQLKQPIPQNVLMFITEARRREEKREAKRVANRRSACTSRARKKTLVKEMTEINARLKRQALILALLPDLVIVIDTEGVITFCSAQVERILQHNVDDLIGSQLSEILIPASREKLRKLMRDMVDGGKRSRSANERQPKTKKRTRAEQQESAGKESVKTSGEEENGRSLGGEASESDEAAAAAAVVSERSFPLSIVKVDPASARVPDARLAVAKTVASVAAKKSENSDTSIVVDGASNEPSSFTNSGSFSRSPAASIYGNSVSDDNTRVVAKGKACKVASESLPSSDTSNSSSLSADAKKLQKANANLERNVRWHNRMLKDKELAGKLDSGYKDDVIGADVTANNAWARLSSLQHRAETSSSEEDSGYRESNDSREETSSSASDLSDSNGKRRPMAPTCNICIVRNDLTTLWCEVTSSIRTREKLSDMDDLDDPKSKKGFISNPKNADKASIPSEGSGDVQDDEGVESKEILLCLRPMREGEEKVDESFRFVPQKLKDLMISGTSNGESESAVSYGRRPPKKRHRTGKKAKPSADDDFESQNDIASEVAESLMLMSSKQN